ncbi:hypothetical protein [Micromonospora sp. SH-82]|uniref:hypothetical protein n=1 Tax=Micromonospora sp. SH-82 TaxID=3132938 RepID=UPI003EC10281
MSRSDRRPSRPEQPFYSERTWILSAAFLAGTMLLAGVVWLGRSGDEPAVAPQAGADNVQPVPECPPGPTVESGRATQPDDLTWRTVGVGYRIPVSPSQGPTQVTGELMRCFSRTPIGAVLAANIIPLTVTGPEWQAVADQQVLAGRSRDIMTTRRERYPSETTRRGGGTYAGFAVDRYSPDAAVVHLLIRGGTGYAVSQVELRWDGGDWKLVLTKIGYTHESLGSVTGSAGFTLWRE